jgi:2-C-methyl-D-erythritol 4-phosphate cytidylyltransferase
LKKYALIVAGGSGSRMGTSIPKQFLLLENKPLLFYTIEKFIQTIPDIEIVLVLPANHINHYYELAGKNSFRVNVKIVEGGETRFHSVKNGLEKITDEGIVAIHDAVRPFVSTQIILDCFHSAELYGSGIPAIAVKESIRKITNVGSEPVYREDYRIIQTPQCFRFSSIKKAYNSEYNAKFTDDATVAENYGMEIILVNGNEDNIKITTPSDMAWAESKIKLLFA